MPAHGCKKTSLSSFGKRRFSRFPPVTIRFNRFLLKQGLQNKARADSFHVLLKNLCQ